MWEVAVLYTRIYIVISLKFDTWLKKDCKKLIRPLGKVPLMEVPCTTRLHCFFFFLMEVSYSTHKMHVNINAYVYK